MISRPPAQRALKDFIVVELYTDKVGGGEGERNTRIMQERFNGRTLPLYIILGPDGRERARLDPSAIGLINMETFLEFLKKGLGS